MRKKFHYLVDFVAVGLGNSPVCPLIQVNSAVDNLYIALSNVINHAEFKPLFPCHTHMLFKSIAVILGILSSYAPDESHLFNLLQPFKIVLFIH